MTSPTLRILLAVTGLAADPLFSHAAPPAASASVFVRDETNNGIRWMPWGNDAFSRARAENKLIYLHIGSFTSELSGAMAKQSFANPEVAKFFSDNFVCVVVDRDEQPELAALYRAYVHTVKQADGWPLNVWLTPDLKPVEGATYLPPSEEWGKPGLMNVAKQVVAGWQADAAAQKQKASDAVTAVQTAEKLPAPAALDAAALKQVLADNTEAWKGKADATNGGFGDPPKRLEPELLRFLLVDESNRALALTALRAMADGAIRDPLDGGFFHQSTDVAWRQPYFQKTAADQARVALAYLDAAKVDADPRFPDAARGALTFVLGQFGDPATGFASAAEVSGAGIDYYLWTTAEFRDILGARDAEACARAFGVTENGNIPDDAYSGVTTAKKNILYRAAPFDADTAAKAAPWRARLLAARAKRPGLRQDPTATSGVDGLLLSAFARAGAELNDERFRMTARQLAGFIQENLRNADGALLRLPARAFAAAPEDYAFVIAGLHTYAAIQHDATAGRIAEELQQRLEHDYYDAAAGRYFAMPAATSPALWARVHMPAPAPGDPATAEATMLQVLSTQVPRPPAVATLAAALAADAKDAVDGARGDALLALRGIVTK